VPRRLLSGCDLPSFRVDCRPSSPCCASSLVSLHFTMLCFQSRLVALPHLSPLIVSQTSFPISRFLPANNTRRPRRQRTSSQTIRNSVTVNMGVQYSATATLPGKSEHFPIHDTRVPMLTMHPSASKAQSRCSVPAKQDIGAYCEVMQVVRNMLCSSL